MPEKKSKRIWSSGLILFLLTAVISSLGLLFVFESSVAESFSTFGTAYHYVKAQGMWLILGYFILFAASFTPISLWKKFAPIFYAISIFTLILVFIPHIGMKLNGANRWFSLFGLVTIQPVEFAKLALVTFFASWMSKHQRLAPFGFLTAIPVTLLILQPDLGSTLIFLSIAFGLYFVAGGEMKHILIISAVGLLFVISAIFSSPYRLQRVTTFFNPELDPLGSSFHIRQITLALGQGGWFGQGIGESKQKHNYIPEASSDSILAIVAEEIGFVGVVAISLIYLAYIITGYKIALRYKPGSFEYLLGLGLTIWFSAQTLLNIAAVVALVPLTGIPLPLFSYGGSSLVMIMLATGIQIKLAKTSESK